MSLVGTLEPEDVAPQDVKINHRVVSLSRGVCVFMVKWYLAYDRPISWPTDSTSDHRHPFNMEGKDKSDELYVLGVTAGMRNQQPHDEFLLEDMLMYLPQAQEV